MPDGTKPVCNRKPRCDLEAFAGCRPVGKPPSERLLESAEVVRLNERQLLLNSCETGFVEG